MARVMVAMSGGVDSSVAAALLQEQGHEVVGATMRLLPEAQPQAASRPCCLTQDAEDAQGVCRRLGLPHYVLDYHAQFQALVVDHSLSQYMAGLTPNPCLRCNQELKFRLLLNRALALGFDYLATGHYARIGHRDRGYCLLRGLDALKDQSYFLFTLGQGELRHILFPAGEYAKSQVRDLARERGLPVAEKKESQDICFAPGNYRTLLSQRCEPVSGEIVDSEGQVLGRHKGIAYYTIGQRRGLGLSSSRPRYVVGLVPQRQKVVVGEEVELYAQGLEAGSVSWVAGEHPLWPVNVMARIRYRALEAEAMVYPQGEGVTVIFSQPQRAMAPGQAVVFYQGEELLGGGIIERALSARRSLDVAERHGSLLL